MRAILLSLALMFSASAAHASDQSTIPKSCVLAVGTEGLIFQLSAGLSAMFGCAVSDSLEFDAISTLSGMNMKNSLAEGQTHTIQLSYFPFINNTPEGAIGDSWFSFKKIDRGVFLRAGPSYQDIGFSYRCNTVTSCSPESSWRVTSVGVQASAGIRGFRGNWIFEFEPVILYKSFSDWADNPNSPDRTLSIRVLGLRAGFGF